MCHGEKLKSAAGDVIGQYYLSQKEGRTKKGDGRMDTWTHGHMDTWTHGRMERLIKVPAEFNTGGFLRLEEEAGNPMFRI